MTFRKDTLPSMAGEQQPNARGRVFAVIVLAANALWLLRGAVQEPGTIRFVLGSIAALSLATAIVVWKSPAWLPPAGRKRPVAGIAIAGLLAVAVLVVLAILWLGGQIWR